ncbi:MAG: Slp family lipoprotein [Gammaproteobacteria bacterium]|nr:Slp family lipoprotein [Gammaproteobacteria bacterium]
MKAFWLVLTSLMLAACAAGPPPAGEAIVGSPSVREAITTPAETQGAQVRWGGVIAGVQNRADSSWVEVIARDLEDNGRPVEDAPSRGRFLARIEGFADPADYGQGKEITVRGVVSGSETRQIGDYSYRYPVVNVERVHVWAPRPVVAEPAYPYYYDPWYPWPYYRPFGPWYPYW